MKTPLPDPNIWREAAREAAAAASVLRLAFDGGNRLGGARTASGQGSSLDFKDHRPYLPGDDPRAINWQAYARSGHYILKLYEREVAPALDLAVDVSASMFLGEKKQRCTFSLVLFLMEAASREGADLRVHFLRGFQSVQESPENLRAGPERWLPEENLDENPGKNAPPIGLDLSAVPWRAGAFRVLVSDLLFPLNLDASPLDPMRRESGRAAVLSPFTRNEEEPDWTGFLDFQDCETGLRREETADANWMRAYREAYGRHLRLWKETAAKKGILLARLPAETSLAEALRMDAIRQGAVVLRS